MKKLKEKVSEIVDIAKSCPENLQVSCFDILLKYFLGTLEQNPAKTTSDLPTKASQKLQEQDSSKSTDIPDVKAKKTTQEDIRDTDIHLKAKRFMEKTGVTISELNNLFYKQGGEFLPLFDDLKTTRMAESQIRITLIQCLVNALASGEFEVQLESVRTECTKRKCYDSSNFYANFRNNKGLFDSTEINSRIKYIKLSDEGRKKLADLIKELQ